MQITIENGRGVFLQTNDCLKKCPEFHYQALAIKRAPKPLRGLDISVEFVTRYLDSRTAVYYFNHYIKSLMKA